MLQRSADSTRLVVAVLVTAIVSVLASTRAANAAHAAEGHELIGRHVIVVNERAELRRGQGQPKGFVPAGMMLDVVRVSGGWLWVNRGWVRRADVVAYDQAIEFFTRQIERRPTAEAYSHRSRVHCYHGDFAQALADGDEAVRLKPKLATAYCNRGRAQAALDRPDEAIDDFTQAIELDPQSSTAYCHRGRAWTEKGNLQQAIDDCDQAIRLDPQSAVAYYYRGRARERANQDAEAVADFTRSIELNPHYVPAFNHRGTILARHRRYEKAIADYDAAIKLDPRFDLVHIHYNRGNAWFGLGNHDRALADYRVSLRHNADYRPAVEAMAACFGHQGDLVAAARWQRRARELAESEQDVQLANDQP
jgi:tetratricopeptide (TPR) repeat protein